MATGLTVAGVGGRLYSGTEDGPAVGGATKAPPSEPRGPFRGSQNAPGGKTGPAVTIDQVKRTIGQYGPRDVSKFDIEHEPIIYDHSGNPSFGDSPVERREGTRRPPRADPPPRNWVDSGDIGIPKTGKTGKALIRVSDMGLSDMKQAVVTVYYEVYHHDTRHWLDREPQAEEYGQRMWAIVERRMRSWGLGGY